MALRLPLITPKPAAAPVAKPPRPRAPNKPSLTRTVRPILTLPENQRRLMTINRPPVEPDETPEPEELPEGIALIPEYPVRVIELFLTDGKTRVECLECLHELRADNPAIYKEQLVQGVQMLMMQGVSADHEIMHIYNINRNLASEIRNEVNLRFQATGALINIRSARGEMLLKYEFLEQKLWHDYKSANYQKDKNGIIQNLLTVLERKAQLSGLTQEQINKVLEIKGDSEVVSRMAKQEGLLGLFGKLCDKVEEIESRNRQHGILEISCQDA